MIDRNERRRNQYRHRIFVIMILAAVLPVLILGFYSYHTYVSGLTQRKNLTMQATVNQVKNKMENVLNNIKQYYAEVEYKDEVKDLIDAEDLSYNQYSRLRNGIEILSGPVYLKEYINSYVFINKGDNWVISTTGMYHYEEMENVREIESLLDWQQDGRMQCVWINRMGQTRPAVMPAGRNVILSGYLMALSLQMLSWGEKCQLLINLNDLKLKNLLTEDLMDMDVTVIDTRGKLFYASNEELGNYCTSHIADLETLRDYDSVRLPDGTRHRLTISNATTNGLIYMISYNIDTVQEGAGQIIYMALLLLAISILLLIFAIMGTRIIYAPVLRMMEQFHDVIKDSRPGQDEFSWLTEGFHELVEDKEMLERLVEEQKEQLVELFLTRMIRGELTQEQINRDMERFNLSNKTNFIVLGVGLMQKENKLDRLERDALILSVAEHLPKEIYEALLVKPLIKKNVIFFILIADIAEELEQRAEKLFLKVGTYAGDSFGCQLHGGVSRGFFRMTHLRTAINESVEALKNGESLRAYENHDDLAHTELANAISFYSDFSKNEQPIPPYDLFAEQEIRKAVDSCDQEKAYEMVDQFVDGITARGVSRQDRYFFLHRFLVAILQSASDAGPSVNQIFEREEENLFLSLDSILDPEGTKEFYKRQIIEPIIKYMAQYRRSHSADIMEQVLQLVKEAGGDITLAECAEQLNYHPSYIWRVLKTEKNMTFTDFVAIEKLELAKDMLLQTTLSVAEIAQKLHYTNTQNFIRFFNKHEGITPGKYRQEHKTEGKIK